MFSQLGESSWSDRNWVALWAAFCFFMTLLEAWNWFVFRNQDAPIEAFFNFFTGIVLVFIHRERRREERFKDEMKRIHDGRPSMEMKEVK